MSSCCITVMYDPNAAPRRATPHTFLTHCFKQPLRLFHSTCQTVIHLWLSPLCLRPSLLPSYLLISSPTPTSLCLTVSITLLGLYEHAYGFVLLNNKKKEYNIADSLLWMMHILYIITPHSSCLYAKRGFTVRSKVSDINAQFKQDQSTRGAHRVCSLRRGGSLTASDDSFHQHNLIVWQPGEGKEEKRAH